MADESALTALDKYAATLTDMSETDKQRRVKIMQDFAAFVERSPDQMIEEIYDKVTRKYKKRGFYTDKLKAFSAQVDGPRATQVFTGNVIRAFFIANGLRIPPEQPSWM